MAHPFLSDDWFAAVEALRAQAPEPPAPLAGLTLNIVVSGAPAGDCEVHINQGQFERGLFDGAPTTVNVPFDVAKAIFVNGDAQAGMQAFMAGQIKVQGDMSKIMALQSAGSSAEQQAFQQKLREITA
jgi:SCP-2 sterol transfer family protein